MSLIYLDNAASTQPAEEVLQVMDAVAREHFGNPASAHPLGAAGARRLAEAREELAAALGAPPGELVFTSGGTEANALAILGAAGRARGKHLVLSAIEHPAVLRNAQHLARDAGHELTLVPPDSSGLVQPAAVAAAVRPDTAVVAVMLVNNELGTIQPVMEIAHALAAGRFATGGQAGAGAGAGAAGSGSRGRHPHFHVDAVQGLGTMAFRAPALGADSVALSAHKIHGPKGVGALWVRSGARLAPLWEGGGQERGTRSGSENLPGIAGFARAATLAHGALTSGLIARMAALRDRLEEYIRLIVPEVQPTVAVEPARRAPHISSLSLPGFPAEPLLHALAAHGVIASAGSACASKLRGPSHVLKALGVVDDATAVLRFSLSRYTTLEEIEGAARALGAAVADIGRGLGRTQASSSSSAERTGNHGVGRRDRI